jgi:ribulose kinase
MKHEFFLGIDVGATSARAGIFDLAGLLIGAASQPIQIWRPAPNHVEPSSDDIWRACGRVAAYHAAKYRVFHRLHTDIMAYRKLMNPC